MSLFRAAASALFVLGLSTAASAATILPATGFTTVQLATLPVSVSALGTAVDNGGGSFSFPVTGVSKVGTDTTLFHEGSGLQVGPLALRNFQYTLGSPATFPITLFGDVDGVANDLDLFSIDDELEISLTATSGTALGLPAGTPIGNVTRISFEETPQVPEPTSLLLLGSAFALLARRVRR